MITLKEITKRLPGGRTLFENVLITFNQGHRYGLTGPNGSGKSTLMKILMGEAEATSGEVSMPKKTGFLRQDIEAFAHYRTRDVVIQGNRRLWSAMAERDKLYEGEMTDAVGMRLASLEEIVAEEDGYIAESQAEELLIGMGLDMEYFDKPLGEIPTDQQFRVLLCQALFGNPAALLLDEPTNHLDLDSIGWLENFLKDYAGCLIVTSHDRHFLNAVTTDIADIDYETIILYPGNYDSMIVAKSASREGEERDKASKEKKIAQLKTFIAKFSAGTRASQVQSRMREIERLQPSELKKSNIERPYIFFPPPEKPSGKLVLRARGLRKSFDAPVIRDFSIEIDKGDKIGIIGNNGQGKTTLLKMLAGVLDPDDGTIALGHHAELDYFPQNHAEIVDKEANKTAFDYLKDCKSGLYDQDIRGALGKLLFPGDDAFKPLQALSGGETARLILAGMMLKNRNTLLLDEPNNHLDLESVSALSQGLQRFDGTLVVVSHDRDLIGAVANKIIAFEKGVPVLYQGTLDDYLATRAL